MQRCRPGRSSRGCRTGARAAVWLDASEAVESEKRRGGVIAWMLDDVELRELRIFLAVLVAAMRETGAQRPGAGVRAGCPLPWPATA